VVAGLIIAALFAVSWYMSFGTVAVDFANNIKTKARIYEGTYTDTPGQKPIKEISTSGSFRLKKGEYTLVTTETDELAEQLQEFTLDDNINLEVDPDLSSNRLASILNS